MPATAIREFVHTGVEPPIRGFLHVPAAPRGNGVVLTHGAGSNARAPLLVALAETFSAAGFTVLRCDLPYRQARHWGPPGPGDATRDRAGLKNAVAALQATTPGSVYLAGHSYGGRQSSMLCAEEPGLVPALLLLSYPLHPPRKPEQQRTQHLPSLRTPSLFVHGTRDPFGSIRELEQALKMIPARTKLVAVEGAGHDLGFKGKMKKDEPPRLVFLEFTKFLELSS
ncbi:MAG TPA: alpha/beta fold hydrolase [Candidatus Sulfotelmatobacter sp.]|nr:alpha/beta fold hydrolase [Candidatus Sulfotelmatobacter sp.]